MHENIAVKRKINVFFFIFILLYIIAIFNSSHKYYNIAVKNFQVFFTKISRRKKPAAFLSTFYRLVKRGNKGLIILARLYQPLAFKKIKWYNLSVKGRKPALENLNILQKGKRFITFITMVFSI